jgi:hypothetical protein
MSASLGGRAAAMRAIHDGGRQGESPVSISTVTPKVCLKVECNNPGDVWPGYGDRTLIMGQS